MIDYKHSYKE